jgi:hypothetical protein
LVRLRKVLVFGLAIVVVLTTLTLVAVGCGGGDEQAKATLLAALTKVENEVNDMQTAFTAGGTVPQLKTAKDQVGTDWQAVVTAAGAVKGADVEAAKAAWTKVDEAITAIPDDATLMVAGPALIAPVTALMTVAADLKKLAGGSDSK